MERLGHILDRLVAAFDLNQLRSARRTALDGDCGLAAAEVAGDQRDKLFVRLALYGRGLQLSEPYATFLWREKADPSTRLDLHLNGRYSQVLGLAFQTRRQRAMSWGVGCMQWLGVIRVQSKNFQVSAPSKRRM